jgi:hypothetical protein
MGGVSFAPVFNMGLLFRGSSKGFKVLLLHAAALKPNQI